MATRSKIQKFKAKGLNFKRLQKQKLVIYARSAFLVTKNANRKNKVENEAKRFDPKEKICVSKSSFFRGQPR